MTVAAEIPLALYDGDGVTVAFPAPWRYLTTANLLVELIASDGTVTLRMLGTHYAASAGATDAGGTVTMVTAPAVGQTLRIRRVTPLAQQTQYPTSGNFPAKSHELALDRLTLIAQEQAGDIDDVQGRALQVPFGEVAAVLPAMAARANKFAAFDSAGALVGAVASPGVSASGTLAATTRIVLANLSIPSAGVTAWLSESGRFGLFEWMAGNFTALVAADTLQGICVPSVQAGYGAGVGCWVRRWDGSAAKPEWFGAVINDGGIDCYVALQACLDVTGSLTLGKGNYYSSRGLVLPAKSVVRGQGALLSGIIVNHATDHLISQRGVSGVSYIDGADLEGFAIARTPNPTTPGSTANDISQGHGLHFFMVSNPRVRHVYTYNNLAECYVNNCLSPDILDVRGIRQTGGGGDRWYGFYVDGVTAGGTFGGPSPNPSTTIKKPNMVANAAVGTSYNYYLNGALQDLWMEDPEAAGGHIQFLMNINGATAGDVHIVRPISDGYRTNGINVVGAPLGSSIDIVGSWVAPASGASGSGIKINASHGVNLSGRGDFILASGLRCVDANDCTELDCNFRVANSQNPFYGTNVHASAIAMKAHKSFSGGGGAFGEIITLISGTRNTARAHGTISTAGLPQLWNAGIALDATAANCTIDVTGVANGAATARYTVATVPVTTQGNVSGHVVINPGAGAML